MMSRVVRPGERGMPLGRYLQIHWPKLARAKVAALASSGRLTVDGKRVPMSHGLEAGATVALDVADPAAPSATALSPLDPADVAFLAGITLHEDDDLLILDKPSGLAVHKGTGTTRDLDSLLARRPDARGNRPVLAHRLDKDTSGVLVAARTPEAARWLGKALQRRDVEKSYLAIVSGVPEPARGHVDVPLFKVQTPQGGRVVVRPPDDPQAWVAATDYAVLATAADGGSALVALSPKTGRQHQLRVHMAHLGHPILGDRLYGGAPAPRLMLHAHAITFERPGGGTARFVAPPPAPFQALLDQAADGDMSTGADGVTTVTSGMTSRSGPGRPRR